MTDLETAARKVFETTRNHLGHAVPTWEDLPEWTWWSGSASTRRG